MMKVKKGRLEKGGSGGSRYREFVRKHIPEPFRYRLESLKLPRGISHDLLDRLKVIYSGCIESNGNKYHFFELVDNGIEKVKGATITIEESKLSPEFLKKRVTDKLRRLGAVSEVQESEDVQHEKDCEFKPFIEGREEMLRAQLPESISEHDLVNLRMTYNGVMELPNKSREEYFHVFSVFDEQLPESMRGTTIYVKEKELTVDTLRKRLEELRNQNN